MTEAAFLPYQIPIEITPHAPLAFAERKPGSQFRESLPYVPGAALFGALGQQLAQQANFDEALLRRIRCHNAYPASIEDTWVHPLPLTALQAKAQPQHPIADALIERVCWERQQPPSLIYLPTDDDGRPWEMPDWRFYTQHSAKLAERRVNQRVLTRVAINRQRGTAEDQRLYSPLALVEAHLTKTNEVRSSRFIGSLGLMQAEDSSIIQSLLQEITHLGGRQSTGLGRVSIVPGIEVKTTSVEQRVLQLSAQFQQQVDLYQHWGGKQWSVSGHNFFTINALSDMLLLNQGWLPTQELSSNMLKELTGIDAVLLRSFTRTLTVGGWATLWQQPKATNLAVGMGSVYVFQALQPLSSANYAALEQLQIHGIGERRQEGFGQVRICDEFHLPMNGSAWEVSDE